MTLYQNEFLATALDSILLKSRSKIADSNLLFFPTPPLYLTIDLRLARIQVGVLAVAGFLK